MDDQYAPRTEPGGVLHPICPTCERAFETNNPRAKYCSLECRSIARNKRYYTANKAKVIKKVLSRRKRQRRTKKKPVNS